MRGTRGALLVLVVTALATAGALGEETLPGPRPRPGPVDREFEGVTYRLRLPAKGEPHSLLVMTAPKGYAPREFLTKYVDLFGDEGIAALWPRSPLDEQVEVFGDLIKKTAAELSIPNHRVHILSVAPPARPGVRVSAGPLRLFVLEDLLASGKFSVGTVALANTEWKRGGPRLKRAVGPVLQMTRSLTEREEWLSPRVTEHLPSVVRLPRAYRREKINPGLFVPLGEEPTTHWTVFLRFWIKSRGGFYLPNEDLHFPWTDGPEEGRKVLAASPRGGLVYFYSLGDAEEDAALAVQNEIFADEEVQRLLAFTPTVRIEREAHEELFLSLLLKRTPALLLVDREFQVLKTHQGKIRTRALMKDLQAFQEGDLDR